MSATSSVSGLASRTANLAWSVAFGEPQRSCRLTRVRTRSADSEARPIRAGEEYVTISLVHRALAKPRIATTRFLPVVFAQGRFEQDLHKPIVRSALVGMDQAISVALDGKPVGELSQVSHGSVPLFEQAAFGGVVQAEFTLLASRSEEILKALSGFIGDVRNSFVGDGPSAGSSEDESKVGLEPALSFASKAATAAYPPKMILDIAVVAANALKQMDGRLTARFQFSERLQELWTGHYALVSVRSPGEELADLEYDPERRELSNKGKTVSRRDYLVLKIESSARRTNIAEVPGLGEAFTALEEIYTSGGDTSAALERLIRQAQISPYLTRPDKTEFEKRVRDYFGLLRQESEQSETADNESLLENVKVLAAIRGLQGLWSQAGDFVEKVQQSRAAAPSPPAVVSKPLRDDQEKSPQTSSSSVLVRQSRFDAALSFALRWEGGFSNHKDDRGGPTNKGITQKVYDAWREQNGEERQSVELIEDTEVRAIYFSQYWRAGRCGELQPNLDQLQFDAAVNHGPGGATRILQRSLARIGPPIKIDGAFGPATLAAVLNTDTAHLTALCIEERRKLYQRIVDADPTQKFFLRGWINRLRDLENSIGRSTNESAGVITVEDTPLAPWVEPSAEAGVGA